MIPRRSSSNTSRALALFVVFALAGCPASAPNSPSAELTNAEPPRAPDLGRGPPRVYADAAVRVHVADPVRRVCSGSSPFFDFDSSDARESDQPTMQLLADCMLSGPLAGKSILLVGHTDPRGSDAYNQRLGLERAARMKDYLVTHGVESSRVIVDSRGEEGASPSPDGWAKDRRVEIRLAP